jgi:hypothetical protein
MKTTMTSDRAARLAELELIALCKQHQAAAQAAAEVKKPRRMKPNFYSHYLRPVRHHVDRIKNRETPMNETTFFDKGRPLPLMRQRKS